MGNAHCEKPAAEGHFSPGFFEGVDEGGGALFTEAAFLRLCKTVGGLSWIEEEIGELRAELTSGAGTDRLEDELGDILFAIANLARHRGIDPEAALRRTNDKFLRRFQVVEAHFGGDQDDLKRATLEDMEAAWQAAKTSET